MPVRKTASTLGLVLVAGLLMAGCSAPEPANTTTPSATRTPTPTQTPGDEPSSAPTTAPPAEWTVAELTTACIDFQTSDSGDAGEFEWTTPAATQQDGDAWYVFLQGTITTPDGTSIPAEYTCVVTGPPGSATVDEAAVAE
ncbi:hypothetical protein D9V29_00785 [Mycetocola manganoxydans]|uniref:Ig-like domain-containing protein n=1 Tax=Mycetocola manganoxydans TaxID=699879 RepID=A0A3L7A0Q6_9MICO|nr:hypothetical protein [Mycetocola manganoxydans]RLP73866.1 hypothetical protein D9V29_00785 [Mycetocola manganoxydans]GHD42623.1 hypothetical protein GCM10008097_08770 [Mycetocola manganoxydans]